MTVIANDFVPIVPYDTQGTVLILNPSYEHIELTQSQSSPWESVNELTF
jgi:hypothetical protein